MSDSNNTNVSASATTPTPAPTPAPTRTLSKAEKIFKWVGAIIAYATTPDMVELRKKNAGLFRGTVIEKFIPFMEKYPGIFNKLLDDPENFEMDRFESMLKKMHRIENGQTDYETENLRVGKSYYQEFLEPQLKRQGKKIDVYKDVKLEDTD